MGKLGTFLHLLKTDRRGIYVAAFNNLAHTNLFNNVSDRRFLEIAYTIKNREYISRENEKEPFYIASLCLMTFLLDWAAVSFSAQCVWYIPVICASSMVANLSCRTVGETVK